jgi:hypothetical protein
MTDTHSVITKDIALAASLHCKGFAVTDMEVHVGGRRGKIGVFTFSGDGAQELYMKFQTGSLLVEPNAFLSSVKAVKALVEEGLRMACDHDEAESK